jgi:hypothetical protein
MTRHLLILLFAALLTCRAQAQLTFAPDQPAADLVTTVLPGEGVTIQKVVFKGSESAVARSKAPAGSPLFADGILISTGKVKDAAGPNDNTKTSSSLSVPGDYRADDVGNNRSFDASVFTVMFVPDKDSVSMGFLFASEEYNEGVNNTFNDLFLLELSGPGLGSGVNLGNLPGTNLPVSIRTVNVSENKRFYIDNNPYKLNGERDAALEAKLDKSLLKTFEYDGLTKPLHAGARVKPGAQYTLRILLADVGDGNFDSALLLESFGLVSVEQHKHEVRRRQIAEQRRLDSLHVVDSLATVERLRQEELRRAQAREDSIRSALAAVQNASDLIDDVLAPPMPTSNPLEERFVFKSDGETLTNNESQWRDLDKIADKLIQNPQLRVYLFAPSAKTDQVAAMHVTVVRSYLRGRGVPESHLLEGDKSFAEEGVTLPEQRVEVWVK